MFGMIIQRLKELADQDMNAPVRIGRERFCAGLKYIPFPFYLPVFISFMTRGATKGASTRQIRASGPRQVK